MIRVLIVDDSSVVRHVLTRELERHPELEVVGAAPDPFVAWEMIQRLQPDVLTLDVEMPGMDGITFLRKLMASRPMPVVLVSSITTDGSQAALAALEAGAVEVCAKPSSSSLGALCPLLAEKVFAAASARVERGAEPPVAAPRMAAEAPFSDRAVIAVGASTGGTKALEQVLARLPAGAPGIVIVQHMPEHFTKAFATRLNSLCAITVREAAPGDRVAAGVALVAPGDFHLLVRPSGRGYVVDIRSGPLVSRHRPSVDVLFRSVARAAGPHAVGVILTGMGADGAKGLLEMRQAGAQTIAQDEATCVVYGMPREAALLGAACRVEPLGRIPAAMLQLARRVGADPATAGR